MLASYVDPDQKLHYLASDLGLYCLPMTLLRAPCKSGIRFKCFHLGFYLSGERGQSESGRVVSIHFLVLCKPNITNT